MFFGRGYKIMTILSQPAKGNFYTVDKKDLRDLDDRIVLIKLEIDS